ncbi:hypothetical protein PG993_002378 [Apiospora rasikravindrae]|uniref:Uncharacterized protein n=1 Tax=Apiospora rasikravindrae TaxID=990691 RepID=A0ABR1TWR4_9PEZI
MQDMVHLGSSLDPVEGNFYEAYAPLVLAHSVRLKRGSGKSIPRNDRFGPKTNVTVATTRGTPVKGIFIPHYIYCCPGGISAAKDWIDGKLLDEADTKEVKEQITRGVEPSLALSRGDYPEFTHGTAVSCYESIRCFRTYGWTDEIEGLLQQFRRAMPNDLLPMGILKAGLLNWWYYRDQDSQEFPRVSLPSFLLSFILYIGRAVLCEEVVPHHPALFARACEFSDNKNLKHIYGEKMRIPHNVIDEQKMLGLLNQKKPIHLGRLVTADLLGSNNPAVDPNCIHFKEYLKLEKCFDARAEAIKPFIDLIGNVPNQGVGRFVKPGVRYVALVPVSVATDLNLRPVRQLETVSLGQPAQTELKVTLGVGVIDIASHCTPQLPQAVEQIERPLPPNDDIQDQSQDAHNDAGPSANIDPVRRGRVAARAPSPEIKGEPERKKIKLELPHNTATLATTSDSPDEKDEVSSGPHTSAVTANSLTGREKATFDMIKSLGLSASGREQEWSAKRAGGQSAEAASSSNMRGVYGYMKARDLSVDEVVRVCACFEGSEGGSEQNADVPRQSLTDDDDDIVMQTPDGWKLV